MKRLSINIPTYNRCEFLKKNIDIIINQLRDNKLIHDVEINISDNASTDNTKAVISDIIVRNPDISGSRFKR